MTKEYINDGGHGGTDNGASAFGQKEKEWTLEASLYVDKRLGDHGLTSRVTRTKDVTLDPTPRTNKVKNSGADICYSHHFNAFNGSAKGAETIHSIFSDGKLAQMIADEFKKAGQTVRRVFDRKNDRGTDYYYMHRETGKVETIIIEYFFLDNKEEYNKYKSKSAREVLYECVVKATCKYEGIKYVPPKSSTKVSKSGKLYKVQVGAFGDLENAEKLEAQLKKDGYSVYIEVE